VGEIWVSGPSVAAGYWGRPEETAVTFGARLAGDSDRKWLRTGDLGFLRDGELFVVGRRKDVIVLRGRNVYAEDLEHALEGAHPALRPGGMVAFPTDHAGAEVVVVAAEAEGDVEAIAQAMRARLAERCDVEVHAVVLLAPGALPKTSSGKRQRGACREAWLAGRLEVTGESVRPVGPRGAVPALDRAALLALDAAARREAVTEHLRLRLAAALELAPEAVPADARLAELGPDSVVLLELELALEDELGVAVPAERLAACETLAGLADLLLGEIR
jgi:acyl carrier protein